MNKNEHVAVIVAVYKDVEALELIINSLLDQTYSPDEIIITEDGQYAPIADCIEACDDKRIIHLTQEDIGWRKNRALNRAIATSTSEYLIFIDGDCVPHSSFVEFHFALRQQQNALCGRRSEPGLEFSTKLRNQEMSVKEFFTHYVTNFFALKKMVYDIMKKACFFRQHLFYLKLFINYSEKKVIWLDATGQVTKMTYLKSMDLTKILLYLQQVKIQMLSDGFAILVSK